MVIVFLLLGRWFGSRAKGRSPEALKKLLDMGTEEATVLRDGRAAQPPARNRRWVAVFIVRPGEKTATDGVVKSSSAIDESMLTGESTLWRPPPDHG